LAVVERVVLATGLENKILTRKDLIVLHLDKQQSVVEAVEVDSLLEVVV
jgi:hypothetical protein